MAPLAEDRPLIASARSRLPTGQIEGSQAGPLNENASEFLRSISRLYRGESSNWNQ